MTCRFRPGAALWETSHSCLTGRALDSTHDHSRVTAQKKIRQYAFTIEAPSFADTAPPGQRRMSPVLVVSPVCLVG